jgi:hypothetical protein
VRRAAHEAPADQKRSIHRVLAMPRTGPAIIKKCYSANSKPTSTSHAHKDLLKITLQLIEAERLAAHGFVYPACLPGMRARASGEPAAFSLSQV